MSSSFGGAGLDSQFTRVSAGKARVLVFLDLIGINQLFLIIIVIIIIIIIIIISILIIIFYKLKT